MLKLHNTSAPTHLNASAVSCAQLQKEGSVAHSCASSAPHTCASRARAGLLQEIRTGAGDTRRKCMRKGHQCAVCLARRACEGYAQLWLPHASWSSPTANTTSNHVDHPSPNRLLTWQLQQRVRPAPVPAAAAPCPSSPAARHAHACAAAAAARCAPRQSPPAPLPG